MATAANINIDDYITCPVCMERYNDPRLLSCGHQFCLKCLLNLVGRSTGGRYGWNVNRDIKCPSCRKSTGVNNMTGVSGLARPVVMNELQAAVSKMLISPKMEPKCETCDQPVTPSHYCYDCHSKICEQCKTGHTGLQAYKHHGIVDLTHIRFCEKDEEPATVYCYTCKKLGCSRCTMKSHRGHEVLTIAKAAEKGRQKIHEHLKTIQTVSGDSEQVTRNISSTLSKVQSEYSGADANLKHISSLLKKVDAKLTDTISTAAKQGKEKVAHLQQTKNDVAQINSEKKEMIQLCESLLGTACEADIVVGSDGLSVLPQSTSKTYAAVQVPKLSDALQTLQQSLEVVVNDSLLEYATTNTHETDNVIPQLDGGWMDEVSYLFGWLPTF